MKLFHSLVLLLITVTIVRSQPNFPENGPLYNDDVVPRIDITIDPDTLDWLFEYENLESNIEFTAKFVFDNGTVKDTIYPVGFRLRGNTSRYAQKKSFKVSFNTFTSGGKYFGVEKLNLNGEHNDPSVMRSKICWDVLRKMEVPAPRSNHVRVYINNNYYGLYISVEHIDEEFVKSRFMYNDGNLFKCLWPADLNYLGDDPDLYKLEHNGRRAYQLKTNKEADDYSDIARFIDVLNNSSSSELACGLDEVFNTYDYLKVIAADILFGNWDGYIYNKNNYYLYHNTTTGKFEYIPYDLDNTLGVDWVFRDWANRNIYDWQQHGDNYRPLYEQIMDNQELRRQYTYYMYQLVNSTIDYDSLKAAVEQRRDMVSQYLTNDPYYPLDYGYTMNDFYNSYYEAHGGHVKYGIFPYLQTRMNSINDQLESTTMDPVIKYIQHNRSAGNTLWVRAYVDVENNPAVGKVVYTIEGQGSSEVSMYDDGNHNDGNAGDRIFGGKIDNIPENTSLTYQVVATDNGGKETIMPCEPVFVPGSGSGDVVLFINEFMASNESTIADEHGDYNDWIEVYNPENETIWLGDKYLTDKLSEPDKWQMPDAYIEPGEFVLFWADGDTDQGPFHTNFKLKKDGEEIGIFESNLAVIDEIVYGAQTTDVSYGRKQDGNPDWMFFPEPTPGTSNGTSNIVETGNTEGFTIYPNPASGDVVYLSEKISYRIYNVYGQLIYQAENYDIINITGYNKGIYVVVSDKGTKQILIIN